MARLCECSLPEAFGESDADGMHMSAGLELLVGLVGEIAQGRMTLGVRRELDRAESCALLELRFVAQESRPLELRLVIARRIAELIGAGITIERHPERALTLTLALALRRASEAQAEKEEGSGSAPVLAFDRAKLDSTRNESSSSKSVLVVDREPTARKYLSHILSLAGFTVRVAASLDDAVSLAREAPPDAVTLDHTQLCLEKASWVERTKQDSLLAHVPIILVRGLESEHSRGPVLAAEIVNKPIDPKNSSRPLPGTQVRQVSRFWFLARSGSVSGHGMRGSGGTWSPPRTSPKLVASSTPSLPQRFSSGSPPRAVSSWRESYAATAARSGSPSSRSQARASPSMGSPIVVSTLKSSHRVVSMRHFCACSAQSEPRERVLPEKDARVSAELSGN